jgi:ATP-dependent Clp protease ATP-binding subunit ClpA
MLSDLPKWFLQAVNKEFSPEFRNRLDAIVPFVPLTKQIAVSIAKKEIQNLNQRLAPKNVCIEVTDKCLEFLVEEGYSKEFGARNMSRTVENLISSALVDEVLFGRLEKGGNVIVDVDNEEIKFVFE